MKTTDKTHISVNLYNGDLPKTFEELQVLEIELGKRMSFLNGKSTRAFNTASYHESKGNPGKAMIFMKQRKYLNEEIQKLGTRLAEVQMKLAMFRPKIEMTSPLYFHSSK